MDRQVQELRRVYAGARTQEHFRQVGLMCRDILISLGHVVFDPDRHLPDGDPLPKRDDPSATDLLEKGSLRGG